MNTTKSYDPDLRFELQLFVMDFAFCNRQTWISNRRRKYRLMGIEIPPPKGGPAVFTASSPGNGSTEELSPDEERFRMVDSGEDLNDGGSLSPSEGRTSGGGGG